METIIELFLTFMKIGAFSFGGGLAMLPLIEEEIVYHHHWITSQKFVDIVAIAEMTPGPIAINASTFAGYKTAGFLGAAVASIGVVVVSFILVMILARRFINIKDKPITKAVFQGIRPATLGLILSAAVSIARTSFVDFKGILIATIVFFTIFKLKVHPILGIALAGGLGILLY